jgi:hypothetical protein
MILVQKLMILSARSLNMEARVYACTSPELDPSLSRSEAMLDHFEQLKSRGFSFDVNTQDDNGRFRGDNYANYKLVEILLSDFDKVERGNFVSSIDLYCKRIFSKYFGEINLEMESYVQALASSFDFFIDLNYVGMEIFEFKSESKELDSKRHAHYSLWEHFKSYILFFNKGEPKDFVYIQIGFD